MLAERYHLVRWVEEDAFSVVPDSHVSRIEGGAEADCTVKWKWSVTTAKWWLQVKKTAVTINHGSNDSH